MSAIGCPSCSSLIDPHSVLPLSEPTVLIRNAMRHVILPLLSLLLACSAPPAEGPAVPTALQGPGAVQEIKGSLDAADAAGVPEPPADFERVMWAKLQREIGDLPVAASWWAPRTWLPVAVA